MKRKRSLEPAAGSPTEVPIRAATTTTSLNALSWQAKWDAFWFAESPSHLLSWLSRAVAIITGLWFLSVCLAADFWFGPAGLSSAALSATLEAITEGELAARFRITPLWMFAGPNIIYGWCAVGVALSSLVAFSIGGRVIRALLALWVLMLCQRLSWSSGALEPLLIALNGYLVLPTLRQMPSWSNGLALRLIQSHLWLLFCAALVYQLANRSWWDGESVWWLAACQRSTLLSTELLAGRVLLVNALTHAITLATAIAVCCLWPFSSSQSQLGKQIGLAAVWCSR